MFGAMRLLFILLLEVNTEHVLISPVHQCLSWDLYDGENIRFICRMPNFQKHFNVSLIDNREKEIVKCTFYDQQESCHPTDLSHIVRVNYTRNEVYFYVDRESLWKYNGKWMCKFGKEILTTNVSITKGIINEVDVRLESSIRSKHFIEITCSSCQEPVSNNAEFRINGRSEKSLTYDKRSGDCVETTSNKLCKPDLCRCSTLGNAFSIMFPINTSSQTSFSCDLMFSDPVTSAKFSKIAVVEFNRGEISTTVIQTKIIKPGIQRVSTTLAPLDPDIEPPYSNDGHEEDERGFELQWIFLCILFVLLIPLFVGLLKKKLRKRFRRTFIGNTIVEEAAVDVPLLGTFIGKTIVEEAAVDVPLLDTNNSSQATSTNEMCESFELKQYSTSIIKSDKAHTTDICAGAENCSTIELYKGSTAGYQCQPCFRQNKRTRALFYCIQCKEQYCWSCRKSHLSMKMATTHLFLEICNMFCINHGKREFTHICYSHKRLICDQCFESHHRHCKVDFIDNIDSIKESNDSIKSGDIDLMKKCMNHSLSTPNLLELFNSGSFQSFEQSDTQFEGNHYFQKCINAISDLQRENLPKPRISFASKSMESRFLTRKRESYAFFSSM